MSGLAPLIVGEWDLLNRLGYTEDGTSVLGYLAKYADALGPAHIRRRLAAHLNKDQVAIPLDVRAVFPCAEANASHEWSKTAMPVRQVTTVVSAYRRAKKLGPLGPKTYATVAQAPRGVAYFVGRPSFSYFGYSATPSLEPSHPDLVAQAVLESDQWATYDRCFERFTGAWIDHPPTVVVEGTEPLRATMIGASSLAGDVVHTFKPMLSTAIDGPASTRLDQYGLDPMAAYELSELAASAASSLKLSGFWSMSMGRTTRGWVVCDVWPVAAPFRGRYLHPLLQGSTTDVLDLARKITEVPR